MFCRCMLCCLIQRTDLGVKHSPAPMHPAFQLLACGLAKSFNTQLCGTTEQQFVARCTRASAAPAAAAAAAAPVLEQGHAHAQPRAGTSTKGGRQTTQGGRHRKRTASWPNVVAVGCACCEGPGCERVSVRYNRMCCSLIATSCTLHAEIRVSVWTETPLCERIPVSNVGRPNSERARTVKPRRIGI